MVESSLLIYYFKTVRKRKAESATGTGGGGLLLAVGVEGCALHNVGPDVAVEGDAAAVGAAGAAGDRSVVRVEEGLLDRGVKVST